MRRCEQCGKRFTPNRSEQRFCGGSCSASWTAKQRGQIGKVSFVCGQCGRVWEDYFGNNRKFCSRECTRLARRTNRPGCEVCGKPVRLMRNKYCSKHCSNLARPRPGIKSLSGLYHRAKKANPLPQPCANCGKIGKHRHHNDYTKPEDVVWLCFKCHGKLHGKRRIRPSTIEIP